MQKEWKKKFKWYFAVISAVGAVLACAVSIKELFFNEKPEDTLSAEQVISGEDNRVFQNNGDIHGDIYNGNVYYDYVSDTPKSVAKIQDISLQYLKSEDNRMEELYFLDLDDLSGKEGRYYLEDNCCTKLLVSNNSDKEYQIVKFSFHARNIKKDLTPYFVEYMDFNYETENITAVIYNDGWGNANDVHIEMTDKDSVLDEYFNKEDITWSFDKIKADERIKINITKDMLLKYPGESVYINPVFQIVCDETKCDLKDSIGFSITPDGFFIGDYGAPSVFAYGIVIDTDKSEYSFEDNISENIKPNGMIDMPICFFPDVSCYMDFYIELEIYDGSESNFTVRTDEKSVYFHVSHSSSNYDGKEISGDFYYTPDEYFISYPYSEKAGDSSQIMYGAGYGNMSGDNIGLVGIIEIDNGIPYLKPDYPGVFQSRLVEKIELEISSIPPELIGVKVFVSGIINESPDNPNIPILDTSKISNDF